MSAKPSTKKRACAVTRQRAALSCWTSRAVVPAMYDR